ncbi:MAG: hypothetical protein HY535_00755 [Chloroflexi bacterium]|nr:hypothetical protein [Chloroflexota bacterium]
MVERYWEQLKPRVLPYLTLRWVSIVTVALLVLLYVALASRYFQVQDQRRAVERDIVALRARVGTYRTASEEVEARYKRVQEAIPPATLIETDVFETMLKLASEHQVSAQIQFKSEETRQVGNRTYRVINFSVAVSGSGQAVESFLRAMDGEQKLLETLFLGNVNLSTGGGGSASMEFQVYTQPK